MTFSLRPGRICNIVPYGTFLLKIKDKSLLPKGIFDREALNKDTLKSKPRLSQILTLGDFRRLKQLLVRLPFLGILILIPLGVYPNLPQTPITLPVQALAKDQIAEVISSSLPKGVNLPHPGYLTTRFSRWHPGVDIATGLGMPIRSILEGVVTEVNFGFLGYGNFVVVSHDNGFKSLYGHMGRVYVKRDQNITQTTTLGEVGMSGFTSGPHTHLEVYKDGAAIDPLTILPQITDYPNIVQKPVGGPNFKTDLHKSLKPDF